VYFVVYLYIMDLVKGKLPFMGGFLKTAIKLREKS